MNPDSYSSLGNKAAKGAFWIISFSVLGKVVTLLSQIALAWYLLPSEIGLAALAFSITNVISFISGSILKDILIQRQEQFSILSSQVFWLSLTLNSLICLLLFGIAPFSEIIFGTAQVESLILIIAVSIPLQALPTIYSSKIFINLNFQKISIVYFSLGIIQNGCAVLFAASGLGAYSLTIPLIITAIASFILQRFLAGKINISRLDFSLWPILLKSAFWLMVVGLFESVRVYGLNIIIGVIHNPTVAGYFYWGTIVSSQTIFLISANLKNILFPSFTKIQEFPERQHSAFQRSLKILLFLSGLIIGLQLILAKPMIEFIFGNKWYPAIPVVELLSIGLYFYPVIVLATSVLMAKGLYKKLVGINFIVSSMVLSGCILGSIKGAEEEIAKWVTISQLLSGFILLFLTFRILERGIKDLLKTISPPVLFFIPAIVISYFYLNFFLSNYTFIGIMVSVFIFLILFLFPNYFFQKETLQEILKNIFPLKIKTRSNE